MRAIGPFLQLLFFSVFVALYAVTFIPAALIYSLGTPRITPARPRVKTSIHHDSIRRIY
jgi:hypothetical protein